MTDNIEQIKQVFNKISTKIQAKIDGADYIYVECPLCNNNVPYDYKEQLPLGARNLPPNVHIKMVSLGHDDKFGYSHEWPQIDYRCSCPKCNTLISITTINGIVKEVTAARNVSESMDLYAYNGKFTRNPFKR